jgi:hypothetical protein
MLARRASEGNRNPWRARRTRNGQTSSRRIDHQFPASTSSGSGDHFRALVGDSETMSVASSVECEPITAECQLIADGMNPMGMPRSATASGATGTPPAGGSAMPCGLVLPAAKANFAAAFWLPEVRVAAAVYC